jgi:AraC-like DNA-binding protein
MSKTTSIYLKDTFPEVQEFSHFKTHSAKTFIPRFEDKAWTSILYIERGNFQISYETGELLKAKGGKFYFHPPLSLKYQTEDRTITPYSMYHLAVDLRSAAKSLFLSPGNKTLAIPEFPEKPFVRTAPPLMVESFKTVIKEYSEQHPSYLLQIANSIRQIVISAARSGGEHKKRNIQNIHHKQMVDDFLMQNKRFMGPVERLFVLLGVSRSSGYTLFHKSFGISPKEYLLRKKIKFAKKMLDVGNDISTVAYDLCFSSSQNFSTTFKNFTCITPSEYKAKGM